MSGGAGSAGAGAENGAWGSVLTLGVEEELMLVDAETFAQLPVSSEVIPRVRAERGLVKHEQDRCRTHSVSPRER